MSKKQPSQLRASRVAALTAANVAIAQNVRIAQRNDRKASILHSKQQNYMLKVQQLAAEYGLAVPNTMSVRPLATAQRHAPSVQAGACAQVHAIAAAHNGDRKATLAACKVAGINPATAATQFSKFKQSFVGPMQA